MIQSRKWSAIETAVGLAFGLVTSIFIFQPIIFGYYGIDFGHAANTVIAVWFTIISFFRNYATKRFFIWIHVNFHMPKQEESNELEK